MNSREQTLAFILVGLILTAVVAAGGYFLVWEPIQRQKNAEITLAKEIEDLEQKVGEQKRAAARLREARVRSLPADKELAQQEYVIALERMANAAEMPKGYTITPRPLDNSARAVPELGKNKPIYTRVGYELQFKKADMWALKDFLHSYYQLGLLHQITAIEIKRDDDNSAKGAAGRNDLTVTLTTEAILVDGAENRKTLLPVPTAFAALGGAAMHKGLSFAPELTRTIRPTPSVPTLSPVGRDYNLLVLKDPFHGPLPIKSPVEPKPLKFGRLSDVKVKTDEKPSPVRYTLTGDGNSTAVVTALVTGGELYAQGALKVNAKDYTIELPETSATSGSATISVLATSADGKTDKGSFKVSIAEPPPKVVPPGEDISRVVILIGATPRSDGTAWARVKDNANRLRYEIEAKPTGVKVVKEWFVLEWKPDRDYDEAPGVLHISAEKAKTNRTFKIIAVDADGLIVADLKPDGAGTAPAPKAPKGGPPRIVTPKQGHANPLAALGGNRIVSAPRPVLYRWEVGQPLSEIRAIPDDEAKKILEAAATEGPVFDVNAFLK